MENKDFYNLYKPLHQYNSNRHIHIVLYMDFTFLYRFAYMLSLKKEYHEMKICQYTINNRRVQLKTSDKFSLKKIIEGPGSAAPWTRESTHFSYCTCSQFPILLISDVGKPNSQHAKRQPDNLSYLVKDLIHSQLSLTGHSNKMLLKMHLKIHCMLLIY